MALSHPIRVCYLVDVLLCKRVIHLLLLIIRLLVIFILILSLFNKIHGHLSMVVSHSKLW